MPISIWKCSQHHYHWEMQIKTTIRFELKSKHPIIPKHWEDMRKQDLSFIIEGNEKYATAILEDDIKLCYYVNHICIIWSSNHRIFAIQAAYPEKKKTLCCRQRPYTINQGNTHKIEETFLGFNRFHRFFTCSIINQGK